MPALQGQLGCSLFEVQSMATPQTAVTQLEPMQTNGDGLWQLNKEQPLEVLFEDMKMAKAKLRS